MKCAAPAIPFYSQHGEDRIICERVHLPEKGVFVDVGAGHPTEGSNTYHFEQRGWHGLAVDADRRNIDHLRNHRACNIEWCAVCEYDGHICFELATDPTLSSIRHHLSKDKLLDVMELDAFRLETLLEKYQIGKIDLLSIDVEGAELEAWRSMDREKHNPTVVIIEHSTIGRPSAKKQVLKEFRRLPYVLLAETPGNFIFVRKGDFLSNGKAAKSVRQEKKPFSRTIITDIRSLYEVDPATLQKQGKDLLATDKDDPEGLLRLAMACWRTHQLERAIKLAKRLTKCVPGWAFGHYMLSLWLSDLRRLEEALPHATAAWQIEPKMYKGHLSQVLYGMGRWEESEAVIHKQPGVESRQVTVADFNVKGKHVVVAPDAFEGGDEVLFIPWQGADGIVRCETMSHRDGERHDAGLGDMLMYARYINRLREHGAKVTVIAQWPLATLFRRSFGDAVVGPGVVVPPFDFWCRASRCPIAFGDTPATIPTQVPYLQPDPERCRLWREAIDGHKGFRVGLCFNGDERIKKDSQRSIPLSLLAPLAKIPGVQLFSLQIPPQNAELQYVPWPIVDAGGSFNLAVGMEDAAALISELDLVISVDTAIAHLAGALGKPTWLLLSMLYTDPR